MKRAFFIAIDFHDEFQLKKIFFSVRFLFARILVEAMFTDV